MWNKNGLGNGIFDFVIRNDGELIIGEYHTYLSGKGSELEFRTQTGFKGAGKIIIELGKIWHITTDTGHLQTSRKGGYNQYNILVNSGLGIPPDTPSGGTTIDVSYSQK